MPATDSILRYPGGKTQLVGFVQHLMEINRMNHPVYCEPFCGGAGVAFKLLLSGKVDEIILNDFDNAIYSIWYAVLYDTNRFLMKVQSAVLTLDEWKHQKDIYNRLKNLNEYNIDLAFAAFYLNRTNRSGIISGGPIGGMQQDGKYKLGCRFNKETLERKIRRIAARAEHIYLYHMDGVDFIENELPNYLNQNLFIFFDPPYVKQGPVLYKNRLTIKYHEQLAADIQRIKEAKWITTYDYDSRISQSYDGSQQFKYLIRYSAAVKGKQYEFMFAESGLTIESSDRVILEPIS